MILPYNFIDMLLIENNVVASNFTTQQSHTLNFNYHLIYVFEKLYQIVMFIMCMPLLIV